MNGAASPGRTLYEVINASVTTAEAGVVEVAPSPAEGFRVVLLGYAGASEVDNELDWRSGGDSLAGPLLVAGRAHVAAYQREGLAACDANEPLNLHVAQAGLLTLFITYIIEEI